MKRLFRGRSCDSSDRQSIDRRKRAHRTAVGTGCQSVRSKWEKSETWNAYYLLGATTNWGMNPIWGRCARIKENGDTFLRRQVNKRHSTRQQRTVPARRRSLRPASPSARPGPHPGCRPPGRASVPVFARSSRPCAPGMTTAAPLCDTRAPRTGPRIFPRSVR